MEEIKKVTLNLKDFVKIVFIAKNLSVSHKKALLELLMKKKKSFHLFS